MTYCNKLFTFLFATFICSQTFAADPTEVPEPSIKIFRAGKGVIVADRAANIIGKSSCPLGHVLHITSPDVSSDPRASGGSLPTENIGRPIRLNVDDISSVILETWSPDSMTKFQGVAQGTVIKNYSFMVHGIDERGYQDRLNFFKKVDSQFNCASKEDFYTTYPYSLFLRTVISTSLIHPSQTHTISDKGFIISVPKEAFIAGSGGDMSSPMSSIFYPPNELQEALRSFTNIVYGRFPLRPKINFMPPASADSTRFHNLGKGYLNHGWNEFIVSPVAEVRNQIQWIIISGIYISGNLKKIQSRPDLQNLCALAETCDLPIVHIDNNFDGESLTQELPKSIMKGGNLAPEYFEQLLGAAMSGNKSAEDQLRVYASHMTDQPWGDRDDDSKIRTILNRFLPTS
ncbi:MAG: hypothetical protein FJX71_06675 [Alphaproteobacteria bacterium]|nr:hypothetical protein [Alphaproteobacteria bacterium]